MNTIEYQKKNKCDNNEKKKYNNSINMRKLINNNHTTKFNSLTNNIKIFLNKRRVNDTKPLNYLVSGSADSNGKFYIDMGEKQKLYNLVLDSFIDEKFEGMITECRSEFYPLFFDIDGLPFEIDSDDFKDMGKCIIIENSNNDNLKEKKYKVHFPELIVDSRFCLQMLEHIKYDDILQKYHQYMDKCVYISNGNRLLYTMGSKKTFYSLEKAKFYNFDKIPDTIELMNMISIYTPQHTKLSNQLLELSNHFYSNEDIENSIQKDINIILTAPYLSKKQKINIEKIESQRHEKGFIPQSEKEQVIDKSLSYLNVEELEHNDWFKILVVCKNLKADAVFWSWNNTYSKLNLEEDKKRWDNVNKNSEILSFGTIHYLIKKYKGEEFYNEIKPEINILQNKKKIQSLLPNKTILLDMAERAYYGNNYDKYKSKNEKHLLLSSCTDEELTKSFYNLEKIIVEELNKHLCMITCDGGIHYIVENISRDKDFDIKKNEKDLTLLFSNRNFNIELMNFEKGVFTYKKKKINIYKLWQESEQRREKLKKYFNPIVEPSDDDDNFNLFRGFKYSKNDMQLWGDCNIKPLLDHILNVWCQGNQSYCDYILNYFAHIYQKPNEKTKVMLCVKSKYEGAGKSLTINKVFEGMKDYIFATADKDQVLGRFNSQMSSKLIIVLEEAFFSGDKRSKSKLKEYITCESLPIENKGFDIYNENSYHNYITFSNETWYAPVDNNSRRYFCVEASNKYAGIQNSKIESYFNEIANLDSRNIAKFFYERDISQFNPRKFELTEYMIDQMENGFNSVEKYMSILLQQGFIKLNEFSNKSEKLEFDKPIQKERMYAYYKSKFNKDYSFIRDERLFWKTLKSVLTNKEGDIFIQEYRPHNSKRMVKLKSFDKVLQFWKEKYGYDPHNDDMQDLNDEDIKYIEKNKTFYEFDECDSDNSQYDCLM